MSETPACWSALSRDGAREYRVGFMSINSMSTVPATPTCVNLTMSSRGAVSAVEAASVIAAATATVAKRAAPAPRRSADAPANSPQQVTMHR